MEIIVKQLAEEEIKARGIRDWSIWDCGISEFDWEYDEKETCLILEGEADIRTEQGVIRISAGDYVEFPRGLKCRWAVRQPIRKHYNFG